VDPETLIVDFWDVGQGNASVITLPDRSRIIIDVGPRTSPLHDWLTLQPDKSIWALVLSHNHADHVGGLPSILAIPGLQIDTLFMLQGPKGGGPTFPWILGDVETAYKRGTIKNVLQLTAGQQIWNSPDRKVVLKIVFPSFLPGIHAKTQNDTSGIVVMESCGGGTVVWAGDAMFEDVCTSTNPAHPYLLHGPHHGAPQDYPSHDPKRMHRMLRTLAPARCHISVGTLNTYDHPNRKYLRHLADSKCAVTCNQITYKCDPRFHVDTPKPVMQIHGRLGLRPPPTGIACRGPLRLYVTGATIKPDEWVAEHREKVQKRCGMNALCIPTHA